MAIVVQINGREIAKSIKFSAFEKLFEGTGISISDVAGFSATPDSFQVEILDKSASVNGARYARHTIEFGIDRERAV